MSISCLGQSQEKKPEKATLDIYNVKLCTLAPMHLKHFKANRNDYLNGHSLEVQEKGQLLHRL